MRTRLILAFILIVMVTVVTVVVVARQSAAQEVRSIMYRGAMTGVDELAASLEAYYRTKGTWDGVESLLPGGGRGQGFGGPGGMMGAMGAGMMGQRIRLADVQGLIIFDTANHVPGEWLSSTERRDALPLQDGLQTVGYLLAEGGMGFNQGDEQVLLGRLTRAAVIAGLVAGGISLLVALLLAFSLLRPVQELTRAAEKLASGDLAQRVPVRGKDELATLGRTFNSMADSLQQAGESRRAMTADIAHELRNPLAVQRANLEALQDGVYSLTPQNLAPVLEQNLLLTRLVDDLRTLALADAGQLSVERIPTDFPDLVRQVAERFEPQANARQVQLKLDGLNNPDADVPPIRVDPLRIEQILNNLLSNALRYTPDGGLIELAACKKGDTVELAIHDSGPGIPPEALPRIFERFYRGERSRSRSEGGSGLGLSIARQIAEAHGGSLEATNHPDGGAIFTLKLPTKYASEPWG